MNPIQQAITTGQDMRKEAWAHRDTIAHAVVLDVIRNARIAHVLMAQPGTDPENREYLAKLNLFNVLLQSLETDPNQHPVP